MKIEMKTLYESFTLKKKKFKHWKAWTSREACKEKRDGGKDKFVVSFIISKS